MQNDKFPGEGQADAERKGGGYGFERLEIDGYYGEMYIQT